MLKTIDETILGMTKLVLSGKTEDVTDIIRSATYYLKEYKKFIEKPLPDYEWSLEQRYSEPIDKEK